VLPVCNDLPAVNFLDATSNGMELSPAEFDAIEHCDEACEYELLHGVVIVNPIPLEGEADPNGHLEYLLRHYQYSHPQGKCLDQTLQERYVHLPDGSRRKADRVIWTGLGRRPNPKQDVPTIVVEFVSKSRRDNLRDYVTKRQEYLQAGVKEYWVIDRFRGVMTVYRSTGQCTNTNTGTNTEQQTETGQQATEQVVVERGQIYNTPLLPEFALPLSSLLEIADRWRDLD
jgi:Uma2 family endonuclease